MSAACESGRFGRCKTPTFTVSCWDSVPWTVDRVELLDVQEQRVDVFAKHEKSKWTCPECDKPYGLHDHDEERVWRHLDSCGFQIS